jgi:hypothetical protein
MKIKLRLQHELLFNPVKIIVCNPNKSTHSATLFKSLNDLKRLIFSNGNNLELTKKQNASKPLNNQ